MNRREGREHVTASSPAAFATAGSPPSGDHRAPPVMMPVRQILKVLFEFLFVHHREYEHDCCRNGVYSGLIFALSSPMLGSCPTFAPAAFRSPTPRWSRLRH
jgi:hypothetical protein